MPRVRPPCDRAAEAAQRVLDDAGVRHPDQIDVEALAAMHGAIVLYAPITTARGVIVQSGKRAIIQVDERARGKPWGRFTAAHEFGHNRLHALIDHFYQCTDVGEPRSAKALDVEREASDFAAGLLIPERLGAPLCATERATVDHVDCLARTFGTSFEMSAIRFLELTMAPCAVVVSNGVHVKWALESLTFPGTIANWRRLHPDSMAARLSRRVGADCEAEVPGFAWKSSGPLIERAWRKLAPNRTLSFIAPR